MIQEQSIILRKLLPREGTIDRIASVLHNLPLDRSWRLEIHEQKPQRSIQQNKLLWSIYGQIIAKGGEAMQGWSKDDLHEFFLIDHFGGEPKKLFERTRIQPYRRSSKLTKQEFSDLVDHIVRFMSNRGVFIDMPEDTDWR